MLNEFAARIDALNERLDKLREDLGNTPRGSVWDDLMNAYDHARGAAALYQRGGDLDEIHEARAAVQYLRREYADGKSYLATEKGPFKSWATVEFEHPYYAGRTNEAETALALIGETLE